MSDDWRCNHDPDSCARCKLFPACQQPYATEEEAWASVRATDPPIPFSESPPPRLYEKCEGSTHRFRDGATRCRCGRVGATLLNRPPAAPLSTLSTPPERPNAIDVTLLKACEEIETLRSRLSSLERELDGVRKEQREEREAIDPGQLPPGVNFFTARGEAGVTFEYVNHLRAIMGVRKGQSLLAEVARLAASPSALRERSE